MVSHGVCYWCRWHDWRVTEHTWCDTVYVTGVGGVTDPVAEHSVCYLMPQDEGQLGFTLYALKQPCVDEDVACLDTQTYGKYIIAPYTGH